MNNNISDTMYSLRRGILLNLQMVCDELNDRFWEYEARLTKDRMSLVCCRMYMPGTPLTEDILYLLPEEYVDDFPVDQYVYITSADVNGESPNIHSVKHPTYEILNMLLQLFQRYKEFESSMNSVITGGGSLLELCRIGRAFFGNPLYIHDPMFSVIALPQRVKGMVEFDENKETGELHIPLWLINEFKFDEAYKETLKRHRAGIWGLDQYPYSMRSMFVNLWEGDYYYGRLLINELDSSLKPGQIQLAEIFAQYCILIIQRDVMKTHQDYRNYEETLRLLIEGKEVPDSDLMAMMTSMGWKKEHKFLCIKFAGQGNDLSIRSESALRGELASLLKGCVLFFQNQTLCLLYNLSLSDIEPQDIPSQIAPLIRESYIYAGVSNPVRFEGGLKYASAEADAALSYIRGGYTTKWMVAYAECALTYALKQMKNSVPEIMMVPMQLLSLMSQDREKGTQYYETLRAYIRCERSIPKTAAAMYVHRTTLLYRLDKIKELLHMDLDDENVRLHLMLAFQYLDEEKGLSH